MILLIMISANIMELAVDEDERLQIIGEKIEKKKKDKKRRRNSDRPSTSHSSIKDEKDAKKSANQKSVEELQKELEKMKETIATLTASKQPEQKKQKYALDFSPVTYLALGFIESANWIAEKIAPKMKARMDAEEGRWEVFKMIKPPDMRSIVTCAAFNRGEVCRLEKWHTTLKKINSEKEAESMPLRRPPTIITKEELRVHACTLCLKALGVLCMHSVLDCPWTLEENWK
jgi:hypothetical protein